MKKSDMLRFFPVSVKFEKKRFYVVPPCVYFLVHRGDVVYVGKSENLRCRLEDHRLGIGNTSKKGFSEAYYIPIREELIDVAEMAFIKFFRAKYNKQWRTGSWIKYRRGMEPLGKPYTDTEIAVLRTLILL